MSKTKLLDRIAALFRLAENNPSPEEAQAALEKARGMLQEHNLTEKDIIFDNNNFDTGGSAFIPAPERIAVWKKRLAQVISLYFDVRYYYGGYPPRFTFYGIEANTHISASSYASVEIQMTRMARKYPGKGIAKREYKEGLVRGLQTRLYELKRTESSDCTALAVRSTEIAKNFLEKTGVNLHSARASSNRQRSGSSRHQAAGQVDSTRITLNPVLDR